MYVTKSEKSDVTEAVQYAKSHVHAIDGHSTLLDERGLDLKRDGIHSRYIETLAARYNMHPIVRPSVSIEGLDCPRQCVSWS